MLGKLKEYRKKRVLRQIILDDEGFQNHAVSSNSLRTIPKGFALEAATRSGRKNIDLKKQSQNVGSQFQVPG